MSRSPDCVVLCVLACLAKMSRRQVSAASTYMCMPSLGGKFLPVNASDPSSRWMVRYAISSTVQSLSHWQCLLPHPTHHHKCHLSMADTPTTKQNNTSHGQSMSPPFCPPAASLLLATSLTSHSLLAACRPTLVLAIAAQHLVSHPALINAPTAVQTQ
jgi:hypothetical protein